MLSSDFISSLSEDELAMLLYYVNVANRPLSHNIPFEISNLKWFRKDVLIQKLLESADLLTDEGHPIFISLMDKFGIKIELKKKVNMESVPQISQSIETPAQLPAATGSVDVKL